MGQFPIRQSWPIKSNQYGEVQIRGPNYIMPHRQHTQNNRKANKSGIEIILIQK